jgi:hypothetical protein
MTTTPKSIADAMNAQKSVTTQAIHDAYMKEKLRAMAAMEKDQATERDDASDLLAALETLARRFGRVEIASNPDGTIDVRAGGVACYDRSLRRAVRERMQNDVDRVTNKISGDMADAISGRPYVLGAGVASAVGVALGSKKQP